MITRDMQNNESKTRQNQIKIGNVIINSRVISAPMAGITDFVLRKLLRKYSPDCLLTTEMISSEALAQRPGSLILHNTPELSPSAFQISGHKPYLIARAVKELSDKADIIDINMGCPVNKVMKATDGCALMKSPDTAAEIVRAVRDVTDKPVTCKFRLGINQNLINFAEFAQKMQEAGASAVCIHARTRVQMYSGTADWDTVSVLKGKLDIPYFINGDIVSVETAAEALERSGADGVSVGRGLLGNPFLPGIIDDYLKTGNTDHHISQIQRLDVLREHLREEILFRGEQNGIKFFRKFYPYYIKGIRGASDYRRILVTEENYDKIIDVLKDVENAIE